MSNQTIHLEIPERYTPWNQVITAATRHWGAKAGLFEKWDKLIMVALKRYTAEYNLKLPLPYKVDITIIGDRKDKRISDSDGLSMKPIIDALVHNGILIDDNYNYVNMTSSKVQHTGEDRTHIIISEQK